MVEIEELEGLCRALPKWMKRVNQHTEDTKKRLDEIDARVKVLESSKTQPAQDDEALVKECLSLIREWRTSSMTNAELARKIIAAVRAS